MAAHALTIGRDRLISLLERAHVDWKEHESRYAGDGHGAAAHECRAQANLVEGLIRAVRRGDTITIVGEKVHIDP